MNVSAARKYIRVDSLHIADHIWFIVKGVQLLDPIGWRGGRKWRARGGSLPEFNKIVFHRS